MPVISRSMPRSGRLCKPLVLFYHNLLYSLRCQSTPQLGTGVNITILCLDAHEIKFPVVDSYTSLAKSTRTRLGILVELDCSNHGPTFSYHVSDQSLWDWNAQYEPALELRSLMKPSPHAGASS